MRSRATILELLSAIAGVLLLWALHQAVHAQVPDAARAFKREYTAIARSEWGLMAPVSSLAAQIHQESGWNCRAVSRVGARGCAQFMPATAKWIGDVDRDLRGGDVLSPAWGFRAQAVYMKWLHERVRADNACERMAFALAAYNGGLGYVYRRQKASTKPGTCFAATCEINPGIAPANQKENAHYPRRILLELEPRYHAAGWGERTCT